MTSTGHIYKVICLVDPRFCYIGSTFNRLSKRFEKHRGHFKKWLEGGRKKGISCFPYYEKYGIEAFKIVLIKSYEVCREHIKDRKHLDVYETLWINRHRGKCCNEKTPLNLLKKEKYKDYYERNKVKIAERGKEYRENNKVQLVETKKNHYEKNKVQIAKQQKEYREKNKEQIAEKEKEYREKNKEQIAEYKKEHYEKNKEQIAEYKKEHYEKNKEQIAEQRKERYEKNKEQIAKTKKEKVECECGCIVTKCNLAKHRRTQKHQKLMTQK